MQYGCSIEIIYHLLKQSATECKFQGIWIWLSNSYIMFNVYRHTMLFIQQEIEYFHRFEAGYFSYETFL